MSNNKESIKAMIELSDTWKEADKVIEEFAGITDLPVKICYLKGMFDVSVLGGHGTGIDIEKNDYIAMLSAIINKKWG